MLKSFLMVLCVLGALGACAHKGAVRIQCDGMLRPINTSDATPPVTVEPASPHTDEPRP